MKVEKFQEAMSLLNLVRDSKYEMKSEVVPGRLYEAFCLYNDKETHYFIDSWEVVGFLRALVKGPSFGAELKVPNLHDIDWEGP